MEEDKAVAEVKRAIKILGSMDKLARKIGVTTTTVFKWSSGKNRPSAENCIKIELATQGQVKAKDIKPDYEWDLMGR